ncbi:hypothetical protein AB0L40_20635 [Patulibacter sp. NPDC049589]|uniref:hypothetical protein n=1 Tax=Patulibacter sp. NPDC049589 TaxID=3154731 RepID=UPI003434727F
MGFFPTEPPEPPSEEADEDWLAYARFDGHTVPGAVPEPIVVASTPLVTVLATLTVSEDALGITWHTVARRIPAGAARDQLALRDAARRGPLPDEFLRLGVAYDDGRTVTNLPWEDDEDEDTDDERPLAWRMRGGSGTPTVTTTSVLIVPGPDAGPVTLVCEWPAMDVPESRATVPHDVIDRARLLAITIEPIDEG